MMTTFTVIYNLLTYIAGVCSLLMNVAPVLATVKLEEAGTVGGGTVTFAGAQLYNAVTWATYGAFNKSLPLLIPNVLGSCVATYSVLIFLTLAKREERAGKKLPSTTYSKSIVTTAFFTALSCMHVLLCVLFIRDGDEGAARSMTGWEGSIACVVMLSAPLGVFKEIVRTKNAESLQPVMVSFATVNTLFWMIAGCMTRDPFIIVPNTLGLLACVAQIALLLKYGRRPLAAESVEEVVAVVPLV